MPISYVRHSHQSAFPNMDLHEFIVQFQDYLAPKLDTYEQAICLYVFRHSRLLGIDEVTIGFKSARVRIACGIGEKGKPMSENTAYLKLASLQRKGSMSAEDFLRRLYRENYLNEEEFRDRVQHLALLKAWELKPRIAECREGGGTMKALMA